MGKNYSKENSYEKKAEELKYDQGNLEIEEVDESQEEDVEEELVEIVPCESDSESVIAANSIVQSTLNTIIYPDECDLSMEINISNSLFKECLPNKNKQRRKASPAKKHVVKSLIVKRVIGSRIKEGNEPITIFHQKWSDGAEYFGDFFKNQATGIGIFKFKNKDTYNGEFTNDHASGFGIFYQAKSCFVGEWNCDEKNGFGFENTEGNFYCGEFAHSKKNGLGELFWKDTSMYFGEWSNNLMHGFGVYRFADGRIYAGQWVRNKMHGEGEFKWKDGTKYIGSYVEDKKEGFGVHFNPKGHKLYGGYWKNGKQEGVGKTVSNNSNGFGNWKEGQFEGWVDVNGDLTQYQLSKEDLRKIQKKTKEALNSSIIDELDKLIEVRIVQFSQNYESLVELARIQMIEFYF